MSLNGPNLRSKPLLGGNQESGHRKHTIQQQLTFTFHIIDK